MLDKTIISATMLKYESDSLKTNLCVQETEETWDAIAASIRSLSTLCQNGACDFPGELVPLLRSFSRPLTSAMNSERTRLSGVAIDFIAVAASGLGTTFEPLLPVFFPTLLAICGRTNKVIITRAKACILSIIETTQVLSILSYFLHSLKDKSITLRLTAAEGTLTCMNCFNPPDLEKDSQARDIEAIIRATATDANPDIRKVSRKIFEAYKLLLPGRIDSFTAPLTPTMKKYLDIKPTTMTTLPRPTFEAKHKTELSSSASSLHTHRVPSESSHPHSHARSASSAVTSITKHSSRAKPDVTAKVTHNNAPKVRGVEMPPPQFVPVRPAQPSARVISVSRSTSTLDVRKRAISTISNTAAPSQSSSTNAVQQGVSSGFPARPASAKSLNDAPRRPQGPPQASSGSSREVATSGPRRVPLPEVGKGDTDKGPKTNSLSTSTAARNEPAATRPQQTSKLAKAKIDLRTTNQAKEKPKPVPNVIASVPTAASSSKIQEKVPKISRSVTQPTLSQLSRTKATAERKVPIAIASKPTWGRPAPRKPNTLTKSTSSQRLARNPTVGVPLVSGTDDCRPVTPAQVPLPPSPSPAQISPPSTAHGTGSTIPTRTSPPPSLPPTPRPSHEELPQELINSDTDLPFETEDGEDQILDEPVDIAGTVEEDETSPLRTSCLQNGNIPDSEGQGVPDAKIVGLESDEPTPLVIEPSVEDPTTPRALLAPEDLMGLQASAQKTPISALLSSIQRGFLFTPSSPLSPPQSYLSRVPAAEGMKDLTIPFPLDAGSPTTGSAFIATKKSFMFGLGGGQASRLALGSVENVDAKS